MSDELKPKPVPTPPPGRGQLPPEQLPGEGRPPLRTGHVVMSDWTRKQLQAVGWQDGDPIPGDLGQRLQEIQAEVMKEKEGAKLEDSELAVGWQPAKASFVEIEKLPKEKQDEIRAYLSEYKQEVQQQEQLKQHEAELDAQIPDNVQGAMRDITKQQMLAGDAAMAERRAKQQGDDESYVIDDRQQSAPSVPPGAPPLPEGKQLGGVSMGPNDVGSKIDELNRRKDEAAKAPPPKPEKPATEEHPTGATNPLHNQNCPRCKWPVAMPFTIEPTDKDKQAFMAAVLGTNRFEKGYSIMGGNVEVKYRSLTTEEISVLNYQLSADVRNGVIRGDGEYLAWSIEYRFVMGISEVKVGGNIVTKVPALIEWSRQHPVKLGKEQTPPTTPMEIENSREAFLAGTAGGQHAGTPLPRMRQWLYDDQLTQEPLRRILGEKHREFQRLTEALEAMTAEPSFWKGIELPA